MGHHPAGPGWERRQPQRGKVGDWGNRDTEVRKIAARCAPDHPLGTKKEYVLRPMKKAHLEVAAEEIAQAGDAVELLLTNGIDAAMNKFNRRAEPPKEEDAGN